MPCYTITTVKLELKAANMELLRKAVEAVTKETRIQTEGQKMFWYGGSYDKQTGTLTVRKEEQGNLIKRAYTGEVIKDKAKRMGWQVKQTEEFKYQIIKR